jgi:uncharacterized protein YceH (UPF0502 family)
VTERRVLGVLVEKQKTSKNADSYPLTLNALVSGSNQKSNRDPVLNLTDLDVEEALARCQKRGLVARITGSRVERWRHLLYETWNVGKIEVAILAELLLRGPQTEGELRPRVSRMEPIDDLETLRAELRPLVNRNLVIYLTAEDRRGAVLTHGFHEPREQERLRAHVLAQPVPAAETLAPPPPPAAARSAPPAPPPAPVVDSKLPALELELSETRAEVAGLRQQLEETRETLEQVQRDLQALKQALGV